MTNGQVSTYDLKDNGLNQYQSRTVPGVVDVVGQADPNAAVDVGGTTALRQGSWFHHAKGVVNSAGAVHDQVQVSASVGNPPQTGSVSGRSFVPKTPETFTYDEDGNLTHDGRWKYTWDGENRLIEVVANPNLVLPDTAKLKLAFAYDYMGRRISKKVYHWNATTQAYSTSPAVERKYLYDGWNLVAELDGSNNPVRAWTWGLDLSGSLQGAGGVGGLLAASSSAGTHFVTYDGNGNVMKLLNSETGAPEAEYEYGPFGELLRLTGGAVAKENPFRFSTKYQDETGLLYYGYRYYQPEAGRWLSRDPIGEFGGLNLYAMLSNRVSNRIDILGLADLEEKTQEPMSDLDANIIREAWKITKGKIGDAEFAPYVTTLNETHSVHSKCYRKCEEHCCEKRTHMVRCRVRLTYSNAYKTVGVKIPKMTKLKVPMLSGLYSTWKSHPPNLTGIPRADCLCVCKDKPGFLGDLLEPVANFGRLSIVSEPDVRSEPQAVPERRLG